MASAWGFPPSQPLYGLKRYFPYLSPVPGPMNPLSRFASTKEPSSGSAEDRRAVQDHSFFHRLGVPADRKVRKRSLAADTERCLTTGYTDMRQLQVAEDPADRKREEAFDITDDSADRRLCGIDR